MPKKSDSKNKLTNNNPQPSKPQNRILSVDILKGLSVLFMIFIHIPMYLVSWENKQNALYFLINDLAKLSAPIFLFFVGYNLTLFIHNKSSTKQANKTTIKRGILLFIIGLTFTFAWTTDIMHFIGFFMIVLLFFKNNSQKTNVILLILLLIISPSLLYLFDYGINWSSIPYEYTGLWTFPGFFKSLFFNGTYAFFPWFIFALAGSITADSYLKHSSNTKNTSKIPKKNNTTDTQTDRHKHEQDIRAAGVLLFLLGIIIRFTFGYNVTFYPASATYVLITLGITMWLYAVCFTEFDIKSKITGPAKILAFMGTISLSLYILHILVGLTYFRMIGQAHTFFLHPILLYTIGLTIFLVTACYLFTQKYKLGPFELLLRRLSK